ncbi:purine permease [Corynebacterium heidelbergense]|uniref:Purine permease n=1 Tax=Corynebacterium heidelbergense TaxID=2055947 RepID=A0A364V3C5_9CORY|nr:nucleobase:cation symporter-2 family protein [Corynebacterium heidelbergense]RAV31140.1 purine permease [Corynebacterium heidelbergense]
MTNPSPHRDDAAPVADAAATAAPHSRSAGTDTAEPNPAVARAEADPTAPEVYGVDDRPPLGKLAILGLQHVLAMYAGAVAVPLIVGGALIGAGKFQAADLHHLIVADLFVAGLASIIQSVGFWRFGSRMPLIQGVSFVSVAPMISIGSQHGITAIYGAVIATGLFMMLVAPVFSTIAKYFPNLVTGTIMVVIGLSLVSVAGGWIMDANAPAQEQGTGITFLLAGVTLIAVILFHRYAPEAYKSMAILVGIIVGTIVSFLVGKADFASVGEAAWVGVPRPFFFGLPTFQPAAIITMLIVGLVIMTETSGDIIAVGKIVGRPANGRLLSDGLRADGLSTLLGGVFNTFPYTAFAQNVGLVSLTKVFSRYVVTAAGVILIILGMLPKMGEVVASIPAPVLGGAGVALFGMVTASGIRTLATVQWTEIRALIVGVSISIALLPSMVPTFYNHVPKNLAMVLHSGIASAAICVIVLNLLFNREDGGHISDEYLKEHP